MFFPESYSFILSGRKSILSQRLYDPIFLDKRQNEKYVLGLISLVTSNSIPNIDDYNNKFYYGSNEITILKGAYEISDIENYLIKHIEKIEEKETVNKTSLLLKVNLNTLKCEIKCNKTIDFTKRNSLHSILGFEQCILKANEKHISDYLVDIKRVNAICAECNLVTNSHKNGQPEHVIHMFYPLVPPGYIISEVPKNIIYLPVIDEIFIKIVDQNGRLINFNGELITVRLHLQRIR